MVALSETNGLTAAPEAIAMGGREEWRVCLCRVRKLLRLLFAKDKGVGQAARAFPALDKAVQIFRPDTLMVNPIPSIWR